MGFGLVLNFVQNVAANMTYWRGDDTGSDGVSFISYTDFLPFPCLVTNPSIDPNPFLEIIIYLKKYNACYNYLYNVLCKYIIDPMATGDLMN